MATIKSTFALINLDIMPTLKKLEEEFVVITGASQGLGKEFALEFAKRKMNLILVSLSNQGLLDLSKEISRKYNVKTIPFETDLSISENVLLLSTWINTNFNVSILINNAGTGGTKKFVDAPVDYINTIMQVNVVATSILTHQLLPIY